MLKTFPTEQRARLTALHSILFVLFVLSPLLNEGFGEAVFKKPAIEFHRFALNKQTKEE
jgi:hypothetical protein